MQLGLQQRAAFPCCSGHRQQLYAAQKPSSCQSMNCGRSWAPAQHRAEQMGRIYSGTGPSATYGPVPPPTKQWNGVKPEWVRDLEADAPYDEDVARLLEGCGGDPELIRKRMRQSMSSKQDEIVSERFGEQTPMRIKFREVDPFSLWVWLELYKVPSATEREMLEGVLSSWFMVGRLGGFNAMNMQVFNNSADDHSYLNYDAEECESSLDAFFHDMSSLEANGSWMRLWVNLGTSDELALDVLINALSSFSKESVGIKQLVFGGENKDWKVPEREIPRTSIDPMQGPIDLEDMDEMDIDMEDY